MFKVWLYCLSSSFTWVPRGIPSETEFFQECNLQIEIQNLVASATTQTRSQKKAIQTQMLLRKHPTLPLWHVSGKLSHCF